MGNCKSTNTVVLKQYNVIQDVDNRIIDQEINIASITEDYENVQNLYIVNQMKKILNKIQHNTIITKSMEQSLKEINIYFKKKANYIYRLSLIRNIYNYIKINNCWCGVFQMKELEILHLIWNAIYDNENLKHILYTNMLSMYKYHFKGDIYVVCPHGRATRMIDIFSGIIDEYTIKKNSIRKEMMNKCVKIRNDLNIYDEEKLKKQIKKVLHKDYVKSNILSIDEFNTEINQWIECI